MFVAPGNQDITFVIPLLGSDGTQLVASAVEYRIVDQNDAEVEPTKVLSGFVEGDESVTILVTAAQNALGELRRASRLIELRVATEGGIVHLTHEYIIESSNVLEVGENSFQGYGAAVLVGFEIPNLPAWNDASRQDRTNALMAAYRSFSKLRMRYIYDDSDAMTRVIVPTAWNTDDITDLDAAALAGLSKDYLAALCRAQVIEADYLLGGDEIGDIRRAGIMSATIGESSQFFRTIKPIESALCKRAMRELSKYIDTRRKLGRG